MPQKSLTVGNIKKIEKYLEQQKAAATNDADKAEIDELIEKLDEMEAKA